jgi:hypothetical protein
MIIVIRLPIAFPDVVIACRTPVAVYPATLLLIQQQW